jgi:hypothetical protein
LRNDERRAMRSSRSRRPAGRVRRAIDNALLDIRTTRRLGRLLWRPLVSELWSRRARLGHR